MFCQLKKPDTLQKSHLRTFENSLGVQWFLLAIYYDTVVAMTQNIHKRDVLDVQESNLLLLN